MGNKQVTTLSNVLINNNKLNEYVEKHLEHLKHRTYKCYKCGKRGHIACDCDKVCIKCGVPHNEKFCIGEITQFITEMNYIQCSLLKEFRRDSTKLNSVQLVKKMKNYVEKATKKIESFVKDNKQEIEQVPTASKTFSFNIFAKKNKEDIKKAHNISKQKFENDIIHDFQNLYQVRAIEELCASHSELTKAYKEKIENLKMEVQRLANERRNIINEEQFKFKEAKKNGIKALVQYKLSKAKFRAKMSQAELRMANDLTNYKTLVEEQIAFQRYQEEEGIKNLRYAFTSESSTEKTKIISASLNVQIADRNIKKFDKMINILNSIDSKYKRGKLFEGDDDVEKLASYWDSDPDCTFVDLRLLSVGKPGPSKQEIISKAYRELRRVRDHWFKLQSVNRRNLMQA